jgi:hypothetical protein
MTITKWLWDGIVWLSLPLLGVLGGVFVWRRLYRELPFFFLYVLSGLLIGVVRLITYRLGSSQAYFYVYWYSEFAGTMAPMLAIYEVFLRRLFPAFHKVRLYRFLFPAAAFVIAFLAFLSAAHAATDLRAAFDSTSRALDFLRSAVVGFFAALTLLMGRRFAGSDFWIAAGFGIQAAVALANAAIRTRFPSTAAAFDVAEIVTYDLVCLTWLVTFWRSDTEREPPASTHLDPAMLHEARSWETMLKDWLTPGKNKR